MYSLVSHSVKVLKEKSINSVKVPQANWIIWIVCLCDWIRSVNLVKIVDFFWHKTTLSGKIDLDAVEFLREWWGLQSRRISSSCYIYIFIAANLDLHAEHLNLYAMHYIFFMLHITCFLCYTFASSYYTFASSYYILYCHAAHLYFHATHLCIHTAH